MAFIEEGIKQIDVEELKKILTDKPKNVVVIDVREKEEYEAFHIPGIPLIPMQSIPLIIADLKENNEYIFVCRSGNRSQHVALFLKENGIKEAHNFYGGMLAWDADVVMGLENVITDVSKLYE
jgi:rhodanese-related sulfurtransferase